MTIIMGSIHPFMAHIQANKIIKPRKYYIMPLQSKTKSVREIFGEMKRKHEL